MTTLRLYTDDAGETRLAALNPELTPYLPSRVRPPHEQSAPEDVARLVFFRFPPGTDGAWHTAPRRQYLFLQGGALTITPSAGVPVTLRPGDSVLIEDTGGKGHHTTSGPEGAQGIFVHLAGEPG